MSWASRTLGRVGATLLPVLTLGAVGRGPASLWAQDVSRTVELRELQRAIARGDVPGAAHAGYARLRPWLQRLYSDSAASMLWFAAGEPTAQAQRLIALLADVDERGLRPADYDAAPLSQRSSELGSEGARTRDVLRFDAWLSLSAMRLLDHLHRGRVDPTSVGFRLPAERATIDLAALARELAAAPSPRDVLDALDPPFSRFAALQRVLARYRALAADGTIQPPAKASRSIRPGDAWADAPVLASYLVALGDLAPGTVAGDTLDSVLVDGVRRFQLHHGLEVDGVIGPATMAQLRVPLATRVRQIELALERWRWLPHDQPPRLAVVNIPGFRLYLFDRAVRANGPVIRLDVIVGRAWGRRRTPVFAGVMREVIFHPFWDVPPSIARNEEVPHIRRDWSYAEREGFEIVRGGDFGARIYEMSWANLDRVVSGELRLRQRPGPANALGAVKFVFPNDYNVFLHGTPARSLFSYARRDFSHGCIRVSDPAALARFVLQGQEGWDAARIAEAMSDSTGLLHVKLERPIPVFVVYATVMVDEHDVPYFYPDLYGHDATLARALGLSYSSTTIAFREPADGAGRAVPAAAYNAACSLGP